jgi:hypothetical protein
MSALIKRVEKLEIENVSDMPKIDIFIVGVEVGNSEPIGYACNGIEVYREPKETADELFERLKALVIDDDLKGVHIFIVSALN